MRAPLFIVLTLTLGGCASNSVINAPPVKQNNISDIKSTTDRVNQPELDSDEQIIKQKLQSQYLTWQGVPYRMGGLSKKGIDCSGFVYLTFLQQFNLKLPRSTSSQVKVGKKIAKEQLQIGDLVFFNTKKNQKHVGIYFGDSKFIHVSSQNGVIISSLLNTYWSSTYRFARRL